MRLNILQFVCHDLGRELNCYGNSSIKSPRIDALAEEGVLFKNHFCASTPCSPSRGCIMTGRYSHSNGLIGLVNRGWDMPEREHTMVDYLNEEGYETWRFGFQHERKDPAKYRYRHEAGGPGAVELAAAKLIEWLESPEAKKGPWYANIGSSDVHLPFDREKYTFADPAPAQVNVPPFLPDNPDVRLELARFRGAIAFMDDWVGRILDALDRAGLRERTLFIFTTDHGAAFPRAKSTLYDPGIGTALIMRVPEGTEIEPGRCDELLSNVDLAPTLLEMIGAPVPEQVQGRSFWPLLAGAEYEPRKEVFSEKNFHDVYDPVRSIRTNRFKYIRSFEEVKNLPLPKDIRRSIASNELRADAFETRPPEELYDLRQDPVEERNLANDPAYEHVRDDLAGRLEEWMRSTGDFLPGQEPEAPPEQWK